MIDLGAIESAILSATEGEADSICAMALARLMDRTESERGGWELGRANEALSRARMLRHAPTGRQCCARYAKLGAHADDCPDYGHRR